MKFPRLSRLLWISQLIGACFSDQLLSQNTFSASSAGVNISLSLAWGTHFRRAGVAIQAYYINKGFQANSCVRAYYSFKSPGPLKLYPELVLSQGIVYAFGPERMYFNPFFSSVSNQTPYEHSIGYSYNAWFNTARTTQQTGIVALTFSGASLIAENDILGAPTLDRFRTGAFLLQYQYRDIYQAAISCALWTGQFGHKKDISVLSRFYNNCYMDTVGGRYTEISHGLLSLQVKYYAGYGHDIQGNAGVDAEQVRDFIQNRIIHNMAFIPDKWQRTKNCHIPMLDENGHIFLFEEGQKIRPPRPYLNFFSGANVFY